MRLSRRGRDAAEPPPRTSDQKNGLTEGPYRGDYVRAVVPLLIPLVPQFAAYHTGFINNKDRWMWDSVSPFLEDTIGFDGSTTGIGQERICNLPCHRKFPKSFHGIVTDPDNFDSFNLKRLKVGLQFN